jgi:hypothetical protein
MKLHIIAACAAMFAFAQTELAQAAYPSADVSRRVQRSGEVRRGDTILIRDPKAGNKIIIADNKTQTSVKKRLNTSNYPCGDYNPKKHTCGLRRNQEPKFTRDSQQPKKS